MAIDVFPSRPASLSQPAGRMSDGALALIATLIILGVHAIKGFALLLSVGGDNDSLLRLVQVRDLMAGQGWFDLHQYRMGPDGGFVMHWSRLVDAPIAALIFLGTALGGSAAAGEIFAQIVWPSALLAGSLVLLMRIARHCFGEAAVVPTLAIGAAGMHFTGNFAPGALDHHNIQALLTLGLIANLMSLPREPGAALRSGASAGACAALMLAIGPETVPFIAAAGLFVSLWFWRNGEETVFQTVGFGLGLAGVAGAVFGGTVAPSAWGEIRCDAFTAPEGAMAGLAGLGLAAIACVGRLRGSPGARLAALAGLGVCCAVVVVHFFPQCLASPFAGIPQRLKDLWLNGVSEGQPFHQMVVSDPINAAGYYGPGFLAAFLLARRMGREGLSRSLLILAAIGGVAMLLSLWMVRGAFFSIPLGAPILGGFVGYFRQTAHENRKSVKASAALAGAWLVSFNLVWGVVVALATLPAVAEAETAAAAAGTKEDTKNECALAADLAALAAQPPTRVLAVSNLGSPILAHTAHSVLAGPYHRNVAGNLEVLDILMGTAAQARARILADRIGLVAVCPGSSETRSLVKAGPGSFGAVLLSKDVPSWLVPVGGTEKAPLRLFRVSVP